MLTCWVTLFMFSTAIRICLLPCACSRVALVTSWVMPFIRSTAMRIWRPPSACSRAALATISVDWLIFSTAFMTCREASACSTVMRRSRCHQVAGLLDAFDDVGQGVAGHSGQFHGGLRLPWRRVRRI